MIASLLIVGCLLGQTATNDDVLKNEVHKWVKQLDSNQAEKREEAKSELLKLGPSILPLLPEPAAGTTTSGQDEDLKVIRQKLQQDLADATAKASTVTLHAGGDPLSKVLAAIQQQTGNRIVDARPKIGGTAIDPAITVNLEKKPFWEALDAVLDQAGFAVYPYGQQEAIQIADRPPGMLPRTGRAATAGPLRIEPVRIVARRDLRMSAAPSLLLSLEVAWEPRLRPIGLKQRLADVTAKDDAGQSLAVEDPSAESEALPRRGTSAVEIEVPLMLPARPAKEIAEFSGSVRAMVPGKVETFRFTDLLDAKKVQNAKKMQKRIAGATVTLDEVRKNEDNNWEIYVRLHFDDAGDALESHRNWVLQNEAYLEGPDGKPIAYDSSETTERSKNEFGMGYIFALDQSPEKLAFVYKTPGSIVTKDFRYELKGIKLP